MEQQMLFENLDELLEGGTPVITTKWLSLQFDLPIREAECTLAAYSKARKNVSAVFVLSGFLNSHEMLIKLVPLDKVDQICSEFSIPPTCIIYSVQQQPCRDSTTLASVDQLLDISAGALTKLTTIHWVEPLPRDITAPLTTGNATPIIPQMVSTRKDQQINVKKVTNFFAPTAKKSTGSSRIFHQSLAMKKTFESVAETLLVSNTECADLKSPIAVMDDDDDDYIGRPRKSSINQHSGTRKRVIESDDEEEEGPTSTLTTSVKPSPSSALETSSNESEREARHSKGKQRIIVSDSETDSPLAKPSPTVKNITKAETPKGKAKAVCNSSTGCIKPLCLQSITAGRGKSVASEITTNPRVHHHTMKTFIDEDGFMVTEKVWQSVPVAASETEKVDDEEPAISSSATTSAEDQSKAKTLSKPSGGQSTTKSSRAHSKSTKTSNVKQSSLSAFLTKGRNTT